MKHLVVVAFAICFLLPRESPFAQQSQPGNLTASPTAKRNREVLTNADVIEMAGIGLSDDLIIEKIGASDRTDFDTSVSGLKALKAAKISDAIIRVMINPQSKPSSDNSGVAPLQPSLTAYNPSADTPPVGQLLAQEAGQSGNKPRVFLQSQSIGNRWQASRDQSMEMSKDFEQNCPGVRISVNQQMADYSVILNHIEGGIILRDNQMQVADKNGDLIRKTSEGGSINGNISGVCNLIVTDWYGKAAKEGVADAQFNVGMLYFDGIGVKRNYAEAAELWRKAAEQGYAEAQGDLGFLYVHGEGVATDNSEAYFWESLAAAGIKGRPDLAWVVKERDRLASKLTPAALSEAQAQAAQWLAEHRVQP